MNRADWSSGMGHRTNGWDRGGIVISLELICGIGRQRTRRLGKVLLLYLAEMLLDASHCGFYFRENLVGRADWSSNTGHRTNGWDRGGIDISFELIHGIGRQRTRRLGKALLLYLAEMLFDASHCGFYLRENLVGRVDWSRDRWERAYRWNKFGMNDVRRCWDWASGVRKPPWWRVCCCHGGGKLRENLREVNKETLLVHVQCCYSDKSCLA